MPSSAKGLEQFRAALQQELVRSYPLLDTALIAALVYDAEQSKDSRSELHRQLAQLTLHAEAEQQADWEFSSYNDERESDVSPSSNTPDDPSPSPKDFASTSAGSSVSSTLSFTTPLGFLQTAFPSTPQEILIQAIQNYEQIKIGDEDEYDMEEIVQEVLNIEAIREIGERGLEEKDDAVQEKEPNWSALTVKKPKKARKKNKAREGSAVVVGPSTTIRFVPPPRSKEKYSPRAPSREILDPWSQLSSLASQLSAIFPTSPTSYFLSLFHDPKFESPSKALRHDLDQRGTKWTITSSFDEIVFSLLGILGTDDDEFVALDDINLCLRAAEEDTEITLDLVLLLQELDVGISIISHSPPVSPTTAISPALSVNVPKTKAQSTHRPTYAESSKSPQSDRWIQVGRPPKQAPRRELVTTGQEVIHQAGPSRDQTKEPSESDEDISEEECREWAQYYRSKRDEMLTSASQHWKKGRHARGGEVALHYADRSREYDRKSREWALKAARVMVNKKQDFTAGPSMDLHGLTVHEALTLVREDVNKWWNSAGAGGVPSKPLTIITGVGNHSAHRKAVLAPAVYNALTRDGWRVTKRPGQLSVTGLAANGAGRVVR